MENFIEKLSWISTNFKMPFIKTVNYYYTNLLLIIKQFLMLENIKKLLQPEVSKGQNWATLMCVVKWIIV